MLGFLSSPSPKGVLSGLTQSSWIARPSVRSPRRLLSSGPKDSSRRPSRIQPRAVDDGEGADPAALYPLPPENLREFSAAAAAVDEYKSLIESICGGVDDSQPVESYNGSLGVSEDFVDTYQRPVGQLQWNTNLGTIYDNPGNVPGVRWCTGCLISNDLFLTAGHCFDQNAGGWSLPKVNGTNNVIPINEIARSLHVNFNYQDDPNGNRRTEVEFPIEELVEYRLGGLDYAIVRLRGNPGAIFGVGDVAVDDPPVGDMLAIIGHPQGVPKRIEAGPLTTFDGDRIRYNDIDTLGGNSGSAIWQSPSGQIVGVHTNGGCQRLGGSNFGMRIESIRNESATVRRLESLPLPLGQGIYTVRQQSSNRFLDAHETSNDFSVVTRTAQNNSSQRWFFLPVGLVGTFQQISTKRFLDAHGSSNNDFSAVTRPLQNNDTQNWVALPVPGQLATYTLQQLSSRRFLDAHPSSFDFSAVTRPAQNNDTQRWRTAPISGNVFNVTQVVNSRFLDAHENQANDFSAVTRNRQNNETQQWRFHVTGAVYEIEQVATNRKVDAHQNDANDFSVVTRNRQQNDTQRWVLNYLGGESYTIRQLSSGRYLDAHESSQRDFSAVTRGRQNNPTQRWTIS